MKVKSLSAKQKIRLLQSLIVAFNVFMAGLLNIERFPGIGYAGMLLGAFLLLFVLFAKGKSDYHIQMVVLSIEAISLFLTAILYFEMGAQYLQFAFIVAGIATIIAMLAKARKHRKAFFIKPNYE